MANQPYPLCKPNDMPLEKYLLNMLTAIVKKQGGELRLTASDILASSGYALSKSPSEKMDAIILRSSPAGTETYFVTEAPAWTAPTPQKQRVLPTMVQPERVQTQVPDNVPKTSRSAQLSDLSAFLAEERQAERMQERMNQQQEQHRRETGIYPWHENQER